ncbi:hypothetical protein [Pseudomonas sp. PDM11]|uniref:hypothetical protein n=1 Tax=Pseudomonas sp. PDM11 TaxID=2769309 RepID=UPI00177C8448|nr:hypothetical protein [Pseudomonas sp. PDM11]MBD9397993.1 hypothetical protein [Pseudomonas sp. PDM11]
MAKPPVSLIVILDSGLTYGLQKLLLFSLACLLPILGAIGLFAAYKSCFEHGRGILELSRFELIAFVLFIALERRFTYYCQLFGYSFWQGLIRLFSVLGVTSLIAGVGALLHERFMLSIEPILLQPLWLGSYLLALYLCAPAALINYTAQNSPRAAAVEPTLSTPDMESKS